MVKPITGVRVPISFISVISLADSAQMLRRGLVLDLSVAFGTLTRTTPMAPMARKSARRAFEKYTNANEKVQVSEQLADTAGGTVCRFYPPSTHVPTTSAAYRTSMRKTTSKSTDDSIQRFPQANRPQTRSVLREVGGPESGGAVDPAIQ